VDYKKNKRVYILIPIHNNLSETLSCLDCIANQDYKELNIVIIDDGSTDNSSRIIKEKYPDITILVGDGNLWWAGSLYRGIGYVLDEMHAESKDYVLTLNNDMTFRENYISSLVKVSKDNPDALIGTYCIDQKTGKVIDSGVVIDWNTLKFTIKEPIDNTNILIKDIDVLSTRGLFFDAKENRAIHLF
jgi:GT2 family glycosyltransferase